MNIYNRLISRNINIKNKQINIILDNLIEYTDFNENDKNIFNVLLDFINLEIFKEYISLLYASHYQQNSIINIIIDYLSVKYNEEKAYFIIDNFIEICKYFDIELKYNPYDNHESELNIYDFILNKKSNSKNKDISTKAKIEIIKKKRKNKNDNDIDYNELPF